MQSKQIEEIYMRRK